MKEPEFIGREEQFSLLKNSLDKAIAGQGSTMLISGEAGIGKTRIVSEIIEEAGNRGAKVIRGWCLAESLEPLMPVKEALRGADMLNLLSDEPPPKVISAYLMNDAGLLISKAERMETELDADIFASMLKAVGNFIKDSLGMIGRGDSGGLNTIGYANYKIILQSKGRLTLAVVIEGGESEFLIEDMRRTLGDIEGKFNTDIFEYSKVSWVDPKIFWFIDSEKYEGAFIVDDPRIRQENMYDAVLIGLQRLASTSPLLIFLDDIQWADPSTLNLFHYLARNTREDRILLLATYRPEDLLASNEGKPHHLEFTLQNMSRESLFTDIRLERFGPEDTANVIEKALGSFQRPEDFTDRIFTETEGNPFFILEVLKLLAEEGSLLEKDGTWELSQSMDELKLPSKIYDVVIRRLNRLLREQKQILECASVVGKEFASDVVGTTLDINRINLLRSLGEIEKAHKLIHSGDEKYWFDHSKIREVLYNGINIELRREYHKIVGESYLELYRENEIVEELAYHFMESGDRRAVDYLIMAGDKAKSRYANEEAILFYTSAETMLDDGGKLLKLHENLGDARVLVGKCEEAIENFRKARELTDDIRIKAGLIFKAAEALEKNSDYELSRKEAEMGMDMLGDAHGPERCKLLTIMSWTHMRVGEFDEAIKLLEQALDVSGGGNTMEVGMVHHTTGMVQWFRGDYEKALADYEKALKIREAIGDVKGRIYTINNIGVVYMETGRLEEARDYFHQGVEYEERIRNKSGLASALDNIGNSYHTSGDFDKALDYHLRGLELYKQAGDRNGIAWALCSLGYIYPDIGQTEKGIQSHLDSVDICREIGDKQILVYNLCGLGEAYYKARKFEEAHRWIDKALTMSKEIGARREEGASHYVRALTFRDEGKLDSVKDEFDIAKVILADVGDMNLLTILDYEYGIYMKIIGNISMAREILVKAKETFESTGMKGWAAKTEKTLEEL